MVMMAVMPVPVAALGFFFLDVGGVEQHEACQLPRRRRGDDFTAKTAPVQQRNPPAMVQVRGGQQQEVDLGRIKAEGFGVFLLVFPATLEHSAIDQQFPAGAFDKMA